MNIWDLAKTMTNAAAPDDEYPSVRSRNESRHIQDIPHNPGSGCPAQANRMRKNPDSVD